MTISAALKNTCLAMAALVICLSSTRPARATDDHVCEREMAHAAQITDIPLTVLYAVGLTETGHHGTLNPFEMNVDGRTVHSDSLNEALTKFGVERAQGAKLIDIGCMQLDYRWHAAAFSSIADMFDPAQNVRYAATFLKALKVQERTWTLAVARYNAGPNNDNAQKKYICAVIANLVVTGLGRWTPNARSFCN